MFWNTRHVKLKRLDLSNNKIGTHAGYKLINSIR